MELLWGSSKSKVWISKLLKKVFLHCRHRLISTVAVLHSHMPNRQVEAPILLDDCFFPQDGQIASTTG